MDYGKQIELVNKGQEQNFIEKSVYNLDIIKKPSNFLNANVPSHPMHTECCSSETRGSSFSLGLQITKT